MNDRTVAEKLKFKPGMRAALLHVPATVDLGIPADALVIDLAEAQFIVDFAKTQAEAEARIAALEPSVGETDVVWIAYPKGSKAAGYDLNRDTVAAAGKARGLIVNANFSIDATWSAVRMRSMRPSD